MGTAPLTNPTSDRVKAVRALSRRATRSRTGEFIAEGPQVVRELVSHRPEVIKDLYASAAAAERYADVLAAARAAAVFVHEASEPVLAAMTEQQAPQGLIAVARRVDLPLAEALEGLDVAATPAPFVCVLTHVRDPGNAGTVLRAADAAGAAAVIISDSSVDLYNPKVVRSTAGSLVHLPVVVGVPVVEIFAGLRAKGLTLLAADGAGERLLPSVDLTGPHAWVMGNEAWGLPEELRAACDEVVRVPIYGLAESLNLAMAATVCLYASAAATHGAPRPGGNGGNGHG